MVAVADGFEIMEYAPNNSGLKTLWIVTKATATQNDTIAITLPNYGMSATGLLSIETWNHSTAGSIIVTEQCTCTVAAGVLTITLVAATTTARVIRLIGMSKPPKYTP